MLFSTLPPRSVDCECDNASPGTWYNESYPGLQGSTAPRSKTPQSRNVSPVRSIADSRCGEFGYVNFEACSIGSTKSIEGLGSINVPGPPKSSPLRLPPVPTPEIIGTIPFSVDYAQGPPDNDLRWQNADAPFPGVAASHYNNIHTPIPPHLHQISRTRSGSSRGAGASTSSHHFLSETNPLGVNRAGSRSFTYPSQESWGRDSYVMSDYPTCGSQWASPMEDHKPVSLPPRNEGESSTLFQPRVGSERTRAISRSRRSNPDKKLFHCDIPGCGATLTSRHNFKSHRNSHWGIKPYVCGQGECSKKFGTMSETKRHRLNHCQYRSSLQL